MCCTRTQRPTAESRLVLLRAASRELTAGFQADGDQLVEHSLGKGEVISSILIIGSRNFAERLCLKRCFGRSPESVSGPLCRWRHRGTAPVGVKRSISTASLLWGS